jgi:hypothetical protein
MSNFFTNWLIKAMKDDINELLKVDGDELPDKPEEVQEAKEQIGRKAIIDDPYFDHVSQSVLYKHRMSRLSNKTLKDVSLRDWLVSSIIQIRADTLLRFSRPQHQQFKMGFRIVNKDKHAHVEEKDKVEIQDIEDFIYHCGRKDGTPRDDRTDFGTFLKKLIRDALTFGHICVEKVPTRNGGFHRFRPLPAESVYLVDKKASKEQLLTAMNTNKYYSMITGSNDPRKDQKTYEKDIEYYKYVQVSLDQTPLAAFGDEDMIFKIFNPQNFIDSMGYGYSPLELAIITVTNHLNIENYNANFFTQGFAARGVLHLKGTVTQSQLASFRRQFYNNIVGTQHAWKTPIIAGLDDIQWIPLAGTNREMEYINFNNHILRCICTQFQIDPIELGLDYLTTGTGRSGGMQQANNQYKIEYSRERGLYPILMFFEDFMNQEIIPAINSEFAEKYKFEFVGYDDETPQTQVAQLQAEMTVHATMNDLLKASQKEKLDFEIADLPLNQSFWALIERCYTKGEIREKFFKDKGASQRRELQYFPGDPAFMGWQQLLLTIDRQKEQDKMMQDQMQQQQQQQQQQVKLQEAEHSRQQEQHDAAMNAHKNAQAHAVVNGAKDLKETGKEFGLGSKPLDIGGTPVANPINK